MICITTRFSQLTMNLQKCNFFVCACIWISDNCYENDLLTLKDAIYICNMLYISRLTFYCTVAKCQACMQNVTWVQKVKHACKMLSINAKCQTWVQNVEHKCKMSNMSAECQSWLENVEHECKMLNVCKISYISAKCQACLQNVEHKCKMSKMSAKCQR
jgi:uncharacterized membrane protein